MCRSGVRGGVDMRGGVDVGGGGTVVQNRLFTSQSYDYDVLLSNILQGKSLPYLIAPQT